MEKIRLDLETLRVDSFAASPESPDAAGVLLATRPHVCDPFTLRTCTC